MENPNTNSASPATENYPHERDQELADLRGANLSLTQSLLNAHTSRNELKKSLEERDTEIASLRSEVADLRGANNSLQASLMREYTSCRGQAGRPNEPKPNLSTLGNGPPYVFRVVKVADLENERVAALNSAAEMHSRALEAEQTCYSLSDDLTNALEDLDEMTRFADEQVNYADQLDAEIEVIANDKANAEADKAKAEAENAVLRNVIPGLLGMIRRYRNMQPGLYRRIRDSIA
ncbi:hypothetical protein PGQ11_006102 [Apiospora arundinis]|uniref:Uncharacterized protein n=1 Tax=Apiospora arundinis TaxID=335852 RepID=A0ABR2IRP4_9PEZI